MDDAWYARCARVYCNSVRAGGVSRALRYSVSGSRLRTTPAGASARAAAAPRASAAARWTAAARSSLRMTWRRPPRTHPTEEGPGCPPLTAPPASADAALGRRPAAVRRATEREAVRDAEVASPTASPLRCRSPPRCLRCDSPPPRCRWRRCCPAGCCVGWAQSWPVPLPELALPPPSRTRLRCRCRWCRCRTMS